MAEVVSFNVKKEKNLQAHFNSTIHDCRGLSQLTRIFIPTKKQTDTSYFRCTYFLGTHVEWNPTRYACVGVKEVGKQQVEWIRGA